MMISIGVLAYNEEQMIGALISDLGRQTLFDDQSRAFELHIVANGCRDKTVEVARRELAAIFSEKANVVCHVHDLAQAGKANAWNEFIHRFANEETDFVFMLDADIRITGTRTLALTVNALEDNPAANVAIDEPIKDLRSKGNMSHSEKILLAFAQTAQNVRNSVCGQFYCARFSALQKIWLPTGTIGEDGFLRAMLLTDNFGQQEDLDRLVFVEGASHYFETRTELRDILHHQVRLAMGTGINVILFGHLREMVARNFSIGEYIRDKNNSDPKWIQKLIEGEMKRKYFVMDLRFLTRRLRRLNSFSVADRLTKAPVYFAGAAVDVLVFFQANRLLRKGAALGFW